MSKKKKHPKLPNGYGSIQKLSGNRRNSYAVYPPTTHYTEEGKVVRPKALCYVSDWYIGLAILTAYKAGTYKQGMEKELVRDSHLFSSEMNKFVEKLLADYMLITRKTEDKVLTFSELYQLYYNWKYNGKRVYSQQSKNSTRAAYKNCKLLHDIPINEITYEQLQDIVDSVPLKYSSLENVVLLLKQMFRYATGIFLIDKNPSVLLRINKEDDDESGVPFTNSDLDKLWSHEQDDIAQILLILCYSGFRIMELKAITVNIDEMYFKGGLKTKTSKERIVPIHSAIQHIVVSRMKEKGTILTDSYSTFRRKLVEYLPILNLEDEHTSHDCRHTFSMLCEKYKVEENDRKRLLGHSFLDVTNSVYGHRELEELRKEIEKIQCRKCVVNEHETSDK